MGEDGLARLQRLEEQNAQLLRELQDLKRSTRVQNVLLNVVIFPTKSAPQDCSVLTHGFLRDALGLRAAEHFWVERQSPGFIRIRVCSFSMKRRLLNWKMRSALRNQHQLIIMEDLLPEERTLKQGQRPVMQALFNAGFRPTWERCDVVWFVHSHKCVFPPGEVGQDASAASIVSMATKKQAIFMVERESHALKRCAPSSPMGSPITSPSLKHVKPCEAGHTDALELASVQSTHSLDSCADVQCVDDNAEMAPVARTETSRIEEIDESKHSTTTPSYTSSYTPFTPSFSNPGYGSMPYRRKHSNPYLHSYLRY